MVISHPAARDRPRRPQAALRAVGHQKCSFLGLVAIARAKHPIPFRTRPLSAVALMVLRLKTWESKSPPDLVKNITFSLNDLE